LRPQSVLLTFFGDYVADTTQAVSSASVIALLDKAGVKAPATRATLSRMVRRGLLDRHAAGRRTFFNLTPFGLRTVLDGRSRAQTHEEIDTVWDGVWTIITFSLPGKAQRERHQLRAVLTWSGFGRVNSGVWAAPRRVDVVELLCHLDVLEHVQVFDGWPAAPTLGAELVRQSFGLDSVAANYTEFVARWRAAHAAGAGAMEDPLAARVVVSTDWLQTIRDDPRLPEEFLDGDWPAGPARNLYHALEQGLRSLAEDQALLRLEHLTVTVTDSRQPP
jgi:phenylacetic acid degradation operon negative regulatory protein